MPDANPEQLAQSNIDLLAKLQWHTNVTQKLLVMIANAATMFEAYEKQADQMRIELGKTKRVYLGLHSDLQEALNEHGTDTRPGPHNTESGATDAEWGGASP